MLGSLIHGMWVEYPEHVNGVHVAAFAPFIDWQRNLAQGLLAEGGVVEKVTIRDAYLFGSRIGFLLMDVDMHMDGVKLPGAVMLRGTSVAVLLWYKVEDAVHVVLVRQPRVATGRMMWEVPAGMADGDGTLKGQMFKEIQEETGLTLNIQDLKHHAAAPYTSCGLLDERLELYSMRIDPDVMAKAGSQGNRAEGELITNVEAVPLTDPRTLEDGKLQMLLAHLA